MKPLSTGILTINGGSSSVKFALYQPPRGRAQPGDGALHPLWKGGLEGLGQANPYFWVQWTDGSEGFSRSLERNDFDYASEEFVEWVAAIGAPEGVEAIGHRLVHGSTDVVKPRLITEKLLKTLRRFSDFNPEHMFIELELISKFRKRYPDIPQVACFDTAFHHTMPKVARMLPLPRRYQTQGLRRFGFHGISYTFILGELSKLAVTEAARGRVIMAHLGHGASLSAVRDGRPLDTTMGVTPASGLMMATRSGDLDPSMFSFFSRTEGMSEAEFLHMVNHESGLLGVSETSSDIRVLLESEIRDERAAEALEQFCYQARKGIGALTAALGGLDVLVFSGGVGENSSTIRSRICRGLGFMGVCLDENRNTANAPIISVEANGSPKTVEVRIIPTDEQLMIGRLVQEAIAS